MSLPSDSAARKRIPIFSGLFKYFPDALAAVAELSAEANEKHNPGEPIHWSRGKSDDHQDCAARHLLDVATGHRAALRELAWRSLAMLQLDIEVNGPIRSTEYDPRVAPYKPPGPPSLEVPDRVHAGCCDCDKCMKLREIYPVHPVDACAALQCELRGQQFDDKMLAEMKAEVLEEACAEEYSFPRSQMRFMKEPTPTPSGHRVSEYGSCDCAVCIAASTSPVPF